MRVMRPYQFCSKEECSQRQDLGQVSELEATVETCLLPQSKRRLDPRYAVGKYRRSAAGGNDGRSVRGRKELFATLLHLIQVCATFRASPNHPKIENLDVVISFVTDRLRACQSDATRLMFSSQKCAPASWHACVIRILIWLRYTCCRYAVSCNDVMNANTTARTIDHMRSTAYDAYWSTREQDQKNVPLGQQSRNLVDSATDDDDEMLCYDAISRICVASNLSTAPNLPSLETSWNGMLLEFTKRRQDGMSYPLWNLALEIASHARRDEYYVLWGANTTLSEKIPILARSILSGEILLPWRYRTVQYYNISFGKGEMVTDMNRLLGIDSFSRCMKAAEQTQPTPDTIGSCWSVEYAKVFGLPVEEEYNNENDPRNTGAKETISPRPTIRMKLKHVAMPEFDYAAVSSTLLQTIRDSDRRWIFGKYYDDSHTSSTGLKSECLCQLLEFGSPSKPNRFVNTCFNAASVLPNDKNVESLNDIISPTTSLSRALAFSSDEMNDGNPTSVLFGDSEPRHRTSPLKTALDRIKMEEKKKKGKICRFFRTSKGCRFGDKCRFDHV